jgi:hypothetical protein
MLTKDMDIIQVSMLKYLRNSMWLGLSDW